MKRALSLILALCVALSLIACGQQQAEPLTQDETQPAQEQTATEPIIMPHELTEAEIEIQTAIDIGLVPESIQGDYAEVIRYNEFCEMLTRVILLRYGEGEYLDAWKSNAALALACDDPMTRGGGLEAIFAAALTTSMDDYHSGVFMLPDVDGETHGAAFQGMPWHGDLFPMLDEPYVNLNWGEEPCEWAFQGAERYWHRVSGVSHKMLLDYDGDAQSFHMAEPFTRADAVCAALRCYESWVPREYVTTTDLQANAYDRTIITDALLQKESALPEPAHDRLPSEWRGMSIYSKGTTWRSIIDFFHERDIRFLAENGMNFARLYLSFTSLRYPDFPEDGNLVNLSELRELDQMIAWAMEYDVHLSLCMLSPPGYAEQEDSDKQAINDTSWPEPERWELIHAYWVMLANRYADIPSKNLTFELNTEWSAGNAAHRAEYAERWGEIVADIHTISPERVLIASFDTAQDNKLRLAESMASLGVSVATHPYDNDGFRSYDGGRIYDKETFYQSLLLPYIEIADRYGVGFMVNEFTFYDRLEDQHDPIPLEIYMEEYGNCIDVFEEHQIGYVLTFLSHGQVGLIGDAREQYSMWSNYPDYLGWQTYTYDNGLSETFPVNNTLLNLIKQHMK